jgi:hypothetical protein
MKKIKSRKDKKEILGEVKEVEIQEEIQEVKTLINRPGWLSDEIWERASLEQKERIINGEDIKSVMS